jgi:plastocyanin
MPARRILSLVLMIAAIVSCQFTGSNYGPGMGAASGSNDNPSISGFAFHPAMITTSSGTTVTWTNYDGTAHTVTETSGPAAFDSNDIAPGSSYSLMLTLPGTYTYMCQRHPTMMGTIIVQ